MVGCAALAAVPAGVDAETVAGAVVLGTARVERAQAQAPLGPGDDVLQGDQIRTEAGRRVRILLTDKSVLDIGPETTFMIRQAEGTSSRRLIDLRVIVGRLWARVSRAFGAGSRFRVESENAVAGVRGTSFVFVTDDEGRTTVSVLTGQVSVRDRTGTTVLLNRLQQSAFHPTGAQGVRAITVAQGASLAGTLRTRSALNPDGATTRLNRFAATPPGSSAAESRQPETRPAQDLIPPLLQDPGISRGNAKVRGTIDVKN